MPSIPIIFLLSVAAIWQEPPSVPGTPQGPPSVPGTPSVERRSYLESARRAVAQGKPLVIFVGTPSVDVSGCVSVELSASAMTGYPAKGVIVAATVGDWLNCVAVLPATATAAQVRAALPIRTMTQPSRLSIGPVYPSARTEVRQQPATFQPTFQLGLGTRTPVQRICPT